jgi:hypothetical protein
MKPFLTALVLCPWLALSAWSQPTPLPPQQPLSQVKQFLGLTDAQVTTILQNNNELTRFSFEQQRQIQNAQFQIAVETSKDQLDPMAIGTLYAGIESACRDLREKAATSQKQNISILTDAQKTKLNMLSDAIKLAPIISEAQSGNLLGSQNFPTFAFTGIFSGTIPGVTGFSDFLLGVARFPLLPGCASPFPGFVIPANRIFGAPPGTSPSGTAEANETAATASPSSHWFTKTFVEPNAAPRQ